MRTILTTVTFRGCTMRGRMIRYRCLRRPEPAGYITEDSGPAQPGTAKVLTTSDHRDEILSHPENSVPQSIVLRYQKIGGILYMKQRSNCIVSI
jgi:hypothetical protein